LRLVKDVKILAKNAIPLEKDLQINTTLNRRYKLIEIKT